MALAIAIWDPYILKYSPCLLSTRFCNWVFHPTDYRGSCGAAAWQSSCSSDSCYEAKRKHFNGIIESCLLFSHSILLYSAVIIQLLSIDVLQSICISCISAFQAALHCVKS